MRIEVNQSLRPTRRALENRLAGVAGFHRSLATGSGVEPLLSFGASGRTKAKLLLLPLLGLLGLSVYFSGDTPGPGLPDKAAEKRAAKSGIPVGATAWDTLQATVATTDVPLLDRLQALEQVGQRPFNYRQKLPLLVATFEDQQAPMRQKAKEVFMSVMMEDDRIPNAVVEKGLALINTGSPLFYGQAANPVVSTDYQKQRDAFLALIRTP